jgi:hypothetical protein
MSARTRQITALRVFVATVVAIGVAVYVPKMLWPASTFYAEVLPPSRLVPAGAIAKLACLAAGAFYGVWCARTLDAKNPARVPWALLAGWLSLWTLAQLGLMAHLFVLHEVAPVPSPADAAFLLGYVLLFAGQLRFIVVYRKSGFPIGSAREHATLAAVAAAAVAILSYVILAPIGNAEISAAERFINLSYPVMDLAALVPTIVMIRIALSFRPGKVWTVWASLLLGFVSLAIGDFVAAYMYPADVPTVDPWIHLTYLLGYFFVAVGMRLEHDLLTA